LGTLIVLELVRSIKNTFVSHNSTNVTASNGFMCDYSKQILQMPIGELCSITIFVFGSW